MDVLSHYDRFKLATSNAGVVTLAWINGADLKVTDLRPNTWDWSKPEVVAASVDQPVREPDDVALAYDGSGRLLVAWTVNRGNDHRGRWRGIGVKERIRSASGNWQPSRMIALYPKGAVRHVEWAGLTLSSGKRSFALGWYADLTDQRNRFPNVSGFRILKGDDWQPVVRIGAEGSPVQVQLFEGEDPQALWILPGEKRLMHASVRPDGTLGKPQVLANADWSLSTAFDSNQAVAGWEYDDQAWASVWDGRRWTKPKMLGDWNDDSAAVSPIATAFSRGRASVFWGAGWAYSLWEHGEWGRTRLLSQHDSGWDVSAGALDSGEIVFSALGHRFNVVHLYRSGNRTPRSYPADQNSQYEASTSSAKAVAHAWEEVVYRGEDYPIAHLYVWVYRP
jgi:hypothetical protein